jgi:PTS hybrid protein
MAFDIVECKTVASTHGNGFVGLVLVSHSAAIAGGLAELVAQVAGSDVPIVTAGGGPDGTLGTDGARVLEAMLAAERGSGAVVLAELDDASAARIALADGPLVEGAIAAGVTASTGAPLAEVARAAEEARGARKL